MKKYQFASQYLAKVADGDWYGPESGYTGDWEDDGNLTTSDDPGAIDWLSGAAMVGAGVGGFKGGRVGGEKLADYIYRNGIDGKVRRALKNLNVGMRQSAYELGTSSKELGDSLLGRASKIDPTLQRGFKYGVLKGTGKAAYGLGNKLQRAGLSIEDARQQLKANDQQLADLMKSRAEYLGINNATKAAQAARSTETALQRMPTALSTEVNRKGKGLKDLNALVKRQGNGLKGGTIPKNWSKAGRRIGGLAGTLGASALAYALTNPRARKEMFG